LAPAITLTLALAFACGCSTSVGGGGSGSKCTDNGAFCLDVGYKGDGFGFVFDSGAGVQDVAGDTGPETTPDVIEEAAGPGEVAQPKDVPGTCVDQCILLGGYECVQGLPMWHTCQLDAATGCLVWSKAQACPPSQHCKDGKCTDDTTDDCTKTGCANGFVCAGGKCVPETPACSPPCGSGKTCKSGVCVPIGTGSFSCAQVKQCIASSCPQGSPQSCNDDCLMKGTAQAQTAVQDLKDCFTKLCETYVSQGKPYHAIWCAYTQCGSQQAACFGSGMGSCASLNDCLNGCLASDPLCPSVCSGKASTTSNADYYGVYACAEEACQGFSDANQFTACVQSKCAPQWKTCFGSTQSGLSCQEIIGCLGACPASDTTCAQGCKAQGTPDAQQQVMAYANCLNDLCAIPCQQGTSKCDACATEFCAAQWAACK